MIKPLYEITNLKCSYDKHCREGQSKVVLEIRDLVIPRGNKVFIVGESGIGKSTILELLGMMNNTVVPTPDTKFNFYEPDGSCVNLMGLWDRNDDEELSAFRLGHFNFIFQSTNLMRNFTAFENVALTRMIQGYSAEDSFNKTARVLEDLGLEHISPDRLAQELSGGQQQRLAFARAILPDFEVLFGDEPTGNLDSDNAAKAMQLLSDKLESLEGSSAIIVSHDIHLSVAVADVIIKIRKECSISDGEVISRGIIDRDSVSVRSEDRKSWVNGEGTYTSEEFESYLRNI